MIYNNIFNKIGNTPIVRINKLANGNNIFAKLEMFNPSGSIKDRIVFAMISKMIEQHKIKDNTIFIEPTSGNTGISLAAICSCLGYKATIVMPENCSDERKALIRAYGANLILTDSKYGMAGAIEKVHDLLQKNDNYISLDQFNNNINKKIHEETTANEILQDTGGNIDFFVAGYGTGGTIAGIAKTLKKYNDNIKIIGISPKTKLDNIPGIGANIILPLLDNNTLDEIILVSEKDAIYTKQKLATEEGIFAGISSGAAMYGSLDIASRKENTGKNIITLFPDSGNRYVNYPRLKSWA